MTDRATSRISDADLEAALLDLGGALAPVHAPGLALAVRFRIEHGEAAALDRPTWAERLGLAAGRLGLTGSRPFRRSLVLALAAVLLIGAIAAALGFGLPGLRIIILGPTPSPSASVVGPSLSPAASRASPTPTPVPTPPTLESLELGDPIDPSAAAAAVGYPVKLPSLPELGPPLGVYARGNAPGARLSAIYAANPAFPADSNPPIVTGQPVAIIVMEFPGLLDEGFFKKIIQPGTTIHTQTVIGHEGFWIAGEPHELIYVEPNGRAANDTIRIVGNVLAWNDGDLTFRIEGAHDLASALRIAESIR
ncbi:MAG: hypothetical protein ACXWWR_03670 [Candidatus Limnocylindrales bacterium]